MFRKITYTDKEDILGLVSIDNKNKVTAQDMNDIKNAINDNTKELDRIMVHVAGDTMTGALNFKANTWNKYGSNVAVGAINTAGTLAVKGLDGKTTIRLVPNGATDNNGVIWTANSATDSTISGTLNGSFKGPLDGNAATTTKLQTARTINDTSFNGTANITTAKWGTARDITLGLTKKSVNGSANMAWSLAEIGALPAAGGVMTGDIEFSNVQTGVRGIIGTVGDNDFWRVVGGATASDAGYLEIATADGANEPIYFRQYSDKFKTIKRTLTLLDANGNTSLPGNLSCVNITASGTSTFNGNTKISGTLGVTGNTTVGGTLGVTGAGTFNDTLTVNKTSNLKGNATVGGALDVTGATKLKSTADITGNTTVGGTLGVTGATTLNNTTTLKGKMYTNSTIESSLTTTTYLQGNQGNTIINSTANAGEYTMLAKMNSTNGYFTTGVYNKTYLLQYTNKATVTAGTNSVTKSVTLLDEDGNATFPEKVIAKEFSGTFTGNSSTTTTLQTSRKINGTNFNGSADITTDKWGAARNINISDATGSNTGANVSVNGGANATLKLPSTIVATLSGNASTATVLKTGRKINNTTFDGSADITTAKWGTARTISITGEATGSASIDGSANASISITRQKFNSSNSGDGGKLGYLLFAQLKIKGNYANTPVEFTLIRRAATAPCRLSITFQNAGNTDPGLASIVYFGYDFGIFIRKSATSTWDVYYTKEESYGHITVADMYKTNSDGTVDITYPGTYTASVPSGVTYATLGYNVLHSDNATKLQNARTIQTNLASTSAASFNGTANITPGVTGTLPLANGGTGATTKKAAEYNILNGLSNETSEVSDNTVVACSYMNPSNTSGVLYTRKASNLWTYFKGKITTDMKLSSTGNAASSTKATQDSAGQQINSTYIKGLSVSGRTITYTKGDDTTGTITTQDTTYPIKSVTINGSYATKYRTQTKGNTASGDYISTIRNDTANVSNSPQFGSGLAWGRGDTHGYMYMDYSSAAAYVGSGNADKLNWVKKLAFAPHSTNVIASASGWSSSSPSTCTINIGGVTASNIVEVGLGSNASDDQVKACMKASIAKITQANGKITLYAYGTKPTINIPLSIVIMDK